LLVVQGTEVNAEIIYNDNGLLLGYWPVDGHYALDGFPCPTKLGKAATGIMALHGWDWVHGVSDRGAWFTYKREAVDWLIETLGL